MAETRTELVAELQATTMCVALHKRQFGRRRSWTDEQTARAASMFGADAEYLRGTKKLLNDKHEAYRGVLSVLSQAGTSWKGMTVPFPEPGKRLMRRDRLAEFEAKMASLRGELGTAVGMLDAEYPALKAEAQQRLQDLFDASNYPDDLADEFGIEWEYPSTSPPEYLRTLAPELYEAECRKLAAKFDEAITLAEQAFVAEMSKTVGTLMDRLAPQEVVCWAFDGVDGDLAKVTDVEQRGGKVSWRETDGKRQTKGFADELVATTWLENCHCRETGRRLESKRIQESAVGNLKEFFDRFSAMSVRSNAQLDALVEQAKAAVEGVDTDAIRKDDVGGSVRRSLQETLAPIAAVLDKMTVATGGRRINFSEEE